MPCGPWMFVISVNTNFWAMSTRVHPLPSSPSIHSSIPALARSPPALARSPAALEQS